MFFSLDNNPFSINKRHALCTSIMLILHTLFNFVLDKIIESDNRIFLHNDFIRSVIKQSVDNGHVDDRTGGEPT